MPAPTVKIPTTLALVKLVTPDIFAFPLTSKRFSGFVVPIPTNPAALTIKLLSST